MGRFFVRPPETYHYGTDELTFHVKLPHIFSQPSFEPVSINRIACLFGYKICPNVAFFKLRNIFILINGQPAGGESLPGMKQSLNHLFAFQAVTRQFISFS